MVTEDELGLGVLEGALPEEEIAEDELGGVDEELEEPAPVDYSTEENIAKLLTKSFLTELGARVKKSADDSYKSFEGWRKNVAENLDLYNGRVPDTGMDQRNITPVHLPHAKRAVRIFSSKLFPQLYPPTGEIFNLVCKSPDLKDRAERCTVHMNFQLRNEMSEYIPSHERGQKQLLIQGSIFETFRYDAIQKRPVQEIFLAEEFWIPYTAKTDRPDLADVSVKTLLYKYQQHELEALEDVGYYIGIKESFEHSDKGETKAIYPADKAYDAAGAPLDPEGGGVGTERETPVQDASDDNIGAEKPYDNQDGHRRVLEQDRMIKLPGEPAARMVTICYDEASSQVLRVSFCEKEDLKDKARFNSETQVWQQTVQSNQASHEAAMAAFENALSLAGTFDPFTAQPFPDAGMPPIPPEDPPQPLPAKKVPWHRHVKYDCDVNPNGALGIGVVDDVKGHNILANKIATRGVSLMTMSLQPTLIASRQSTFGREDTPLVLGQVNESNMSAQQVENGAGLKQIAFPPPDPGYFKVLELADKSSQEVTAFDIAAGAPGMSGETATESELRHSNATDNISAIGSRVNRARAWSLKNLAYINSITLPPEGVTVYREGQPILVTPQDYEAILGELEVTFNCDPQFESKPLKERRAQKRLQAVMSFINAPNVFQMPVIDPITAITMMREATVDYLKTVDAPTQWIPMILQSPMPQIPGINAPAPPPQGAMNGPQGANQAGGPPAQPQGPGPTPGPAGVSEASPPS